LREQSGQQKKVRFDIKKQSPMPDASKDTLEDRILELKKEASKLQEKRLEEIKKALDELTLSKERMMRKIQDYSNQEIKMEIDQEDPVVPPRRSQAPPPPAYSFQNPSSSIPPTPLLRPVNVSTSPPHVFHRSQSVPLIPTMPEADRHWRPGQEQALKEINARRNKERRNQYRENRRNERYASRKERALQRSMNAGTMWSDTKTPWEDLAREDIDRINA